MILKKPDIIAVIFLIVIFFFTGGTIFFNRASLIKNCKGFLSANTSFLERCAIYKTNMEGIFNNELKGKEHFIAIYGLIQKVMQKTVVEDANPQYTVVKTSKGALTFIAPYSDITNCVNRLADLNSYLKEKDIPLLYVQAPAKVLEDTQLPPTVQSFANGNADNLLQGLARNGIDYLDLRAEIHHDFLDKSNLFYDTDHHWKTPTAFWAFGKVAEKLNRDHGLGLYGQYTSIANYQITEYKDAFLGSQGRRVGPYFAGLDDYETIVPEFETNYQVKIIKSARDTEEYRGSFRDVFIRKDYLDLEKPVSTNRYAAYNGGDYPQVIIKNLSPPLNAAAKALLIEDSFGLPFYPFFSEICRELRVLDLRYYQGSVYDYIESFDPDQIIILYNPSSCADRMFYFGPRM